MTIKSIFLTLIRIALGILFIFSGYVKAIDPIGYALKFGEYFEAFHLTALEPGALFFGILLAVAELLIGICLLLGIQLRLVSWITLLFMLFFTALTFVLALTDLVKDCGCFGDAIKLTNWETFYKNLIILPFVLILFFQRKHLQPLFCNTVEWALFTAIALLGFAFSGYSYRHLPLIDFMPYKVGVNVYNQMQVPEGAPVDEFESSFTYEKNGDQKIFNLDELPDSTWTFVASHIKLIKEGYTPPTRDFSIATDSGYIQDQVLNLPGYVLFLTSPSHFDMRFNKIETIVDLNTWASSHSGLFVLCGSSTAEASEAIKNAGANLNVYHTDNTVLKAMVRSNPGLILLKDGVILKKWNNNDFPSTEQLEQLIQQDSNVIIEKHQNNVRRIHWILIGITGILFLVFSFLRLVNNKESIVED